MIEHLPRLLGSLLLCLGLSACAAAIVGGAATGGYYVATKDRPVGAVADDAAIISTINTRYVHDDLVNALDVSVDSYRGTVTLSGSVSSQAAVQRAETIARSVKGVKRVVSRLSVVPK